MCNLKCNLSSKLNQLIERQSGLSHFKWLFKALAISLQNTGQATESNSFLIPRWGGFMVYNVEVPENASLPHPVELDMQLVMQVFVSQIRLLLGITSKVCFYKYT